jgi:DNA-binding MarR family transcriptional regulator
VQKSSRESFPPGAAAAAVVSRYFEAVAAHLGLNGTDVDCLAILVIEAEASAGRIAELTGLTSGGVTGVLDRLERQGFVTRSSDPEDRRRVLVRLAEGQYDRIAPHLLLAHASATAGADDVAKKALEAAAERQAAALEAAIARLRTAPPRRASPAQGGSLSVPMVDSREATLEFQGGAAHLRVRPGASAGHLLDAVLPAQTGLSVDGARVRVGGRRLPLDRAGLAEIALTGKTRWTLLLKGGRNELIADLVGLEVAGVTFAGGGTSAEVALGEPSGTVPVKLTGGASHIVLRLPPDAHVRVRAAGNLGEVRLGKRVSRTAAPIDWQSPGWDTARDRFEIAIRGGLNRVTVHSGAGSVRP